MQAYREAMAEFAQMGTMEIWYARLSEKELLRRSRTCARTASATAKKQAKKGEQERQGDRRQGTDARQPAGTVQTRRVRGRHVSDHQPATDRDPGQGPARRRGDVGGRGDDVIHQQFRSYRATLQSDRRHLLERFEIIDVARKVVGVGSVGTRAFIVLLQGRDQQDPLFLQVKEATASVLEDHLPKSRFKQPGERVVHGQRMMQAASDIYLGWTEGRRGQPVPLLAAAPRHEGLGRRRVDAPAQHGVLRERVRMDAGTGARSVRRPVAIAGYLGKSDAFDRSITDFSERYADQNEQDYEAFVGAVRSGRLQAIEGI